MVNGFMYVDCTVEVRQRLTQYLNYVHLSSACYNLKTIMPKKICSVHISLRVGFFFYQTGCF